MCILGKSISKSFEPPLTWRHEAEGVSESTRVRRTPFNLHLIRVRRVALGGSRSSKPPAHIVKPSFQPDLSAKPKNARQERPPVYFIIFIQGSSAHSVIRMPLKKEQKTLWFKWWSFLSNLMHMHATFILILFLLLFFFNLVVCGLLLLPDIVMYIYTYSAIWTF